MSLPTADDFNIYSGCLDERTASEHFLNKSVAEAEALLRDNSLAYGQDFMWMGPKAFHFYLEALMNYLKSDDAIGDSDIVSCLLSVVDSRRKGEAPTSAADRVRMTIDYVIANYDKFQVDHMIYGNLLKRYRELRDKL